MTWKTSEYPADMNPCPHCGKKVARSFDVHEALVHPEKRAKPQEFLDWQRDQRSQLAKKKSTKKS
jgi:hypothetical protein